MRFLCAVLIGVGLAINAYADTKCDLKSIFQTPTRRRNYDAFAIRERSNFISDDYSDPSADAAKITLRLGDFRNHVKKNNNNVNTRITWAGPNHNTYYPHVHYPAAPWWHPFPYVLDPYAPQLPYYYPGFYQRAIPRRAPTMDGLMGTLVPRKIVRIIEQPMVPQGIVGTDQEKVVEIVEQPNEGKVLEVVEQSNGEKVLEVVEQPIEEKVLEVVEQPNAEKVVEIAEQPSEEKTAEMIEEIQEPPKENIEQPTTEKAETITEQTESSSQAQSTENPTNIVDDSVKSMNATDVEKKEISEYQNEQSLLSSNQKAGNLEQTDEPHNMDHPRVLHPVKLTEKIENVEILGAGNLNISLSANKPQEVKNCENPEDVETLKMLEDSLVPLVQLSDGRRRLLVSYPIGSKDVAPIYVEPRPTKPCDRCQGCPHCLKAMRRFPNDVSDLSAMPIVPEQSVVSGYSVEESSGYYEDPSKIVVYRPPKTISILPPTEVPFYGSKFIPRTAMSSDPLNYYPLELFNTIQRTDPQEIISTPSLYYPTSSEMFNQFRRPNPSPFYFPTSPYFLNSPRISPSDLLPRSTPTIRKTMQTTQNAMETTPSLPLRYYQSTLPQLMTTMTTGSTPNAVQLDEEKEKKYEGEVWNPKPLDNWCPTCPKYRGELNSL